MTTYYKSVADLWAAFEATEGPTVASDEFPTAVGFQEWPDGDETAGEMHQVKLANIAKTAKCPHCHQSLPKDTRPVPETAPPEFWTLFSTAPGRQKLFRRGPG